jgi:hypothetical protein
MWQGKVLLLAIEVPVLFALLHDYAERPGRRRLALLLAAGAAAVGLSTTAIFLVPVIAAGCLLPVALRSPSLASARIALAGLVATAAYPLAAGLVTKLGGGRTPDVYTTKDVIPSKLVHFVIGTGGFALLGLAAVLIVPALLRRASAGQMLAGTALLVGLLVGPRVPEFIFELTGLGRVLWRLTWALPVAALVGALATTVAGTRGPAVLRAAPALLLCAAMALFGEPLWSASAGTNLVHRPVLKRDRVQVANARALLPHTREGDVVLAPKGLSQTLLILSGRITTVSPRGFFTKALSDVPAMHVPQRRRLEGFVRFGLQPVPPAPRQAEAIRRDLRIVGVDVICVKRSHVTARRLIGSFGYRPLASTRHTTCSRAPAA